MILPDEEVIFVGERFLNAELELKSAMAKYRYVQVFLKYLDSAKALLELQGSLPDLEPARELIRNGREVGRDYEDISIAMERVLNPRRDIDDTTEELEFAVGRFDVDLEIARSNESHDWAELVNAVNSVLREASLDKSPWYEGMSKQHDLLVVDAHSADRIEFYQEELRKNKFKHAPSPDCLEVIFRLSFGKLVNTVPFAP